MIVYQSKGKLYVHQVKYIIKMFLLKINNHNKAFKEILSIQLIKEIHLLKVKNINKIYYYLIFLI